MSSASGGTETPYASTAPATTNFADAARAHVESSDHTVGCVSNEALYQHSFMYEI